MPDAIFAHHSNRKGCDFGYAPSANSCEGANNVDACTVTALDAITAFAVPSPNGHLAAPSVFSGLEVQQVAQPNPSPSLLQASYSYVCQPFSAVDLGDTNTAISIVNAQGWCKCN
jgi:hypothetical protein